MKQYIWVFCAKPDAQNKQPVLIQATGNSKKKFQSLMEAPVIGIEFAFLSCNFIKIIENKRLMNKTSIANMYQFDYLSYKCFVLKQKNQSKLIWRF